MSDRDPYAPPRSAVEVSVPKKDGVWVDKVLRWVGTAGLVRVLLMELSEGKESSWVLHVIWVVLWGGLALGFLIGGRRWHLGIGIFGLLSLVQLAVWGSLLVNVVTMVCGVTLYLRALRA